MNSNLQTNNFLSSINNFNNQSFYRHDNLSNHSITSKNPTNNNNQIFKTLPNSVINNKNSQSLFLSQKLILNSLYLSSIDIPKQFNDQLIKKLMKDKSFANSNLIQNNINDKTLNINNQSLNQFKKTRIPFTKDEDEKIKQLVKRFGLGRWELISHFMERRTAKQCRDRYTNYLVPGVFQGQWTKEEDQLLTQLYNKIGPKWSILQRYIPYRNANNIKNRWNYFLSKQNPSQEKVENGINSIIKNNDSNETKDQNENFFVEEEIKDKDYLFKLENETLENRNLLDFDNEWIFNEYPPEPKFVIDK